MSRYEPDHDVVRRATSYPFAWHSGSYLFRNGEAAPLADAAAAVAGRVPVIASGSNAAPEQLKRKYAAHRGGTGIPVTRASVEDFDSVYSAHITAYGSVAATLFPSPGTELATFITWLDEAELAVMHGTESPGVNYHFAELKGLSVDVEGIGRLDSAFAYVSVAGSIRHEGRPVGLAEVPARGRGFPAMRQPEMQELVRGLTAPGLDLETFIRGNVADEALRRQRETLLGQNALAFAHGAMTIIPVTG